MIKKVEEYIDELNLLKEKTIVLAVSGGIDSMVLFDILSKLDYQIIVAHINHNVRKESSIEYEFVKKYVLEHNAIFEGTTLNKINDGNFHDIAREKRYQFFMEIADKYQTKTIVTAHHADDLLETILMKIIRGSNLYGYGGIKPISKYKGYNIVRPLLTSSRSEIRDYQKNNNIPFMEDSSNSSDKYTRNRIRHNVIPELQKENEGLYKNVNNYSSIIFETFGYIRKNTIKILSVWKNKIDNEEFKNLDKTLRYDIIAYMLEEYNLKLSYQKIKAIDNFIISSSPNKSYLIGSNLVFKKVYNYTSIKEEIKAYDYEFLVNLEEEITTPYNDKIKITRNIPKNEEIYLRLCYNDIRFPLKIRNRRDGDFFTFKYGKKKLKDFFIDNKTPLDERNRIPIVLDSSSILGIPGIIKGPKDVVNPIYIIYIKENNNEEWYFKSISIWRRNKSYV